MSWRALSWAQDIDDDTLNSGAVLILFILANYANDDGYCYPGQAKIAKISHMHERTVRSHLYWLEDRGYIARMKRYTEDGHRTSDGYYLLKFMAEQGIEVPKAVAEKLPAETPGSQTEVGESPTPDPTPSEGDSDIPTGRILPESRVNPSEIQGESPGNTKRTTVNPQLPIEGVSPSHEGEAEPVPKRGRAVSKPWQIVSHYRSLRFPDLAAVPNQPFMLKVASRMLADGKEAGYGVPEIVGCMDWLQADGWWASKGWTLVDIERRLPHYLGHRVEAPQAKRFKTREEELEERRLATLAALYAEEGTTTGEQPDDTGGDYIDIPYRPSTE